ncbi:nuclear transport factor 2 family protein [filamentous cyanobacterium LEGE 11480]|uniref:Nuclear transport factor 2 family protein n=1 Tax=Romeriopsis navalis LEGE 11480 TaxID=2777977 RepID=A0A928Z2Q5_9CYAN|nr:nuclear transport factor 2 family protein [Romeriopsis navalis]MBE9029297.1 nuclear transport factor 2 family protein [Romeriopsis navalis LEGE 11480]
MNRKLENATNLYMEGIRDGNVRDAVTKYTGRRYTQHSTGVRNGIEGFLEFFEPFLERCPVRDIRIVRSIVDGQYVFVQAFQDINNGAAKWVTTDLFDTDQDDKIIEHWDVIAAFESDPGSEHDQIDGPTEIQDLGSTIENKEIIRAFMCDVMVLSQRDKWDTYVDRAALVLHCASDVGAFDEYVGAYNQVFKIIGQGNFVVAYSRIFRKGQEMARFDLFRLSNGRIEELWVNQELVPPQHEWVNGGKF